MYSVLLSLHSWLRWVVVALLVIALVRTVRGWRGGAPWTAADGKVRTAAVAAFDTQLLVGIVLYFGFSPMTPRTFAAMGAYMKSSVLRFFTVEHLFAMILAAAALHVGSARSRRAEDDRSMHKRFAVGVIIAVVLTLIGIPWPGMPYARPLFRF